MSSSKPTKSAKPRLGNNFDPWNSSSSGHQRPDNTPGSTTGWRESRNRKLNNQFRAADGSGGDRLGDTYGAGSEDWDDGIKAVVPKEMRMRMGGGGSVVDMLTKPGAMKGSLPSKSDGEVQKERKKEDDDREEGSAKGRKIFEGLVIYVNGSTYPHVSDHKLKHILTENGANMSLHLGRRKVTHVIVGRPSGGARGAGGGLAGGKLDKEIKKMGGVGVKFVDVEWVLESLKAGKRLPEARFSQMKVASKGQASVYGLYSKPGSTEGSTSNS